MSNEVTKFNFEITSMQQAMEYAKLIADSDLAPKDYKGKAGNVLIAIQMGVEIGLKPLQAIQNIAVINGRPSVWGDAMIALVQNHPLCEYIREDFKNDTAYCIVKRRGDEEEHISIFSKDDAKKAGLLNKPGVWQQYPERMLKLRARAFALRDKFSDILKGIAMREEVMDYEVIEASPKQARISKAQENIRGLIEGKKKVDLEVQDDKIGLITLNEIKHKIDHAISTDELAKIAPLAQHLNEEDKKEMRKYYKKASETLKAAETWEEKVELNEEYEKLKQQLMNAETRDSLDISADLIHTIEPQELRGELLAIYQNRKDQVK